MKNQTNLINIIKKLYFSFLVIIVLAYKFEIIFIKQNYFLLYVTLSLLLGAIFIYPKIPFAWLATYTFDFRPLEKETSYEDFVFKLRGRSTVFNNYASIILVFTVLIICFGFYYVDSAGKNAGKDVGLAMTINIISTLMLILLVQILFRVFKYLIRVAGFYNAKADALEYLSLKPDGNLKEIMDSFTPEKYDMSDLNETSFLDSIKSKVK